MNFYKFLVFMKNFSYFGNVESWILVLFKIFSLNNQFPYTTNSDFKTIKNPSLVYKDRLLEVDFELLTKKLRLNLTLFFSYNFSFVKIKII